MATTNNSLEIAQNNSILTLVCIFDGIPVPSLEWTHNGLLVSNGNDLITITNTRSQSKTTSLLQWMNVTTDADGVFSCVVTNIRGSKSISFTVKVQSKFVHFMFDNIVNTVVCRT